MYFVCINLLQDSIENNIMRSEQAAYMFAETYDQFGALLTRTTSIPTSPRLLELMNKLLRLTINFSHGVHSSCVNIRVPPWPRPSMPIEEFDGVVDFEINLEVKDNIDSRMTPIQEGEDDKNIIPSG